MAKQNWTLRLDDGMLLKDGKSTGVSFASIVTSQEFREVVTNEIDNEILAELLAKSPKVKRRLEE